MEEQHHLDEEDRTFIGHADGLLKIYEAMHGLRARQPDAAAVDADVVWAREVVSGPRTLAIAVTRETLPARTFRVRVVAQPGHGLPAATDADVFGLEALARMLEKMLEPPPRAHRSGPHARRRRN